MNAAMVLIRVEDSMNFGELVGNGVEDHRCFSRKECGDLRTAKSLSSTEVQEVESFDAELWI